MLVLSQNCFINERREIPLTSRVELVTTTKHIAGAVTPADSRENRSQQEGGVNLLAQLWDCAADDLSHYDVTSKPVREISMAAKR